MSARPQLHSDVLSRCDSRSDPSGHTQLEFEVLREAECKPSLMEEITSFLDTQDTSHPFQLPQWSAGGGLMFLLRSQNRLVWYAKAGVLYPAGRVLQPIRALILNRAPVCDNPEWMQIGLHHLVSEASKLGAAYIEVMPEWTGEFSNRARDVLAGSGWNALSMTRASLRLDLSPPPEQLMASFRSGTRYDVRRAEASGIAVAPAKAESDFQEYLALYLEMSRQKQFAAEAPDFLLNLFRWLAAEPHRGGLFLAHESDILRGGIVLVRTGGRCWYLLGATAKNGRVSVGHRLQWHGILWAKRAGCREYDFGGYREDSTSGPAFFKRGFCDRVVHFLPPHRYVVNQPRYKLFQIAGRVRRAF